MFSGSIKDNIVYGLESGVEPSMEEIENAAREAHAHQFIINMPNAYHTLIGIVYVQETFYRYTAFSS